MTIPASISNQVTPNGQQPYTNQQNFGQVIGEISSWCPHVPIPVVQNFINNSVRVYYDRRMWYGLMAEGEINTTGFYNTGSVTLTNGSTSVQGVGTAWTATLVGQQFRAGFIAPVYTVIAVDTVHQVITINMPWGLPTLSTTGYFITGYYYSIPNVKYIHTCKNLQLMYRLCTNVPQTLVDNLDPVRWQMLFPRALVTRPPDPSGNYQVEMWPNPQTQQSFPYLAYVQPPNLVNDDDNFIPYIRCDIVKSHAIADALLYRPKNNPNYSEATCLAISKQKMAEFNGEIEIAAQADEALYRQDVIRWSEQLPYIDLETGAWGGGGATLAAMTAQSAEDW